MALMRTSRFFIFGNKYGNTKNNDNNNITSDGRRPITHLKKANAIEWNISQMQHNIGQCTSLYILGL